MLSAGRHIALVSLTFLNLLLIAWTLENDKINALSWLCLRTAGEVQPNHFRKLTFMLLFNNVKIHDLTGSLLHINVLLCKDTWCYSKTALITATISTAYRCCPTVDVQCEFSSLRQNSTRVHL